MNNRIFRQTCHPATARRVAVFVCGASGVGAATLVTMLQSSLDAILGVVRDKVDVINAEPTAEYSKYSACIVFYVYDVCRPKTLDAAEALVSKHYSSNAFPASASPVFRVLVGNKIDLEFWRTVSVEAGGAAAKKLFTGSPRGPVQFCEVSALTGQHVDFLLDVVLKGLFRQLAPDDAAQQLADALAKESARQLLASRMRVVKAISRLGAVGIAAAPAGAGTGVQMQKLPQVGGALGAKSGPPLSVTTAEDLSLQLNLLGLQTKEEEEPVADLMAEDLPESDHSSVDEEYDEEDDVEDDDTAAGGGAAGGELALAMGGDEDDELEEEEAAEVEVGGLFDEEADLNALELNMQDAPVSLPSLPSTPSAYAPMHPRSLEPPSVPMPAPPPMPLPPAAAPSAPMPMPVQAGGGGPSPAPAQPQDRIMRRTMGVPPAAGAVAAPKAPSAAPQPSGVQRQAIDVPRDEVLDDQPEKKKKMKRKETPLPKPSSRASKIGAPAMREESVARKKKLGTADALDARAARESAEPGVANVDDDDAALNQMEGGLNQLSATARKIREVQDVMAVNIDSVVDRSDRLEDIAAASDQLQQNAAVFKRAAVDLRKKMRRRQQLRLLCCPCFLCYACGHYCYEEGGAACMRCCVCMNETGHRCVSAVGKAFGALCGRFKLLFTFKLPLFDNVLADTENAFQTLAKLLTYLIDGGRPPAELLGEEEEGLALVQATETALQCVADAVYECCVGAWVRLVRWALSFAVVLGSTVALILPSFFTLLIVRTATVEKESKAFGIRQEVIRHEKKEESAVRWVRILLRSLPMTCYLTALPYLLVTRVFPRASSGADVTLYLVLYLCGVIALQLLGSVRAYYSWKTKDSAPPAAPVMYELVPDPVAVAAAEKANGVLAKACSCITGGKQGGKGKGKRKGKGKDKNRGASSDSLVSQGSHSLLVPAAAASASSSASTLCATSAGKYVPKIPPGGLLRNRDGVLVSLGGGRGRGGDTGLPPSQVYYCGRMMRQCRCGTCDGYCGVRDGCPCDACRELLFPPATTGDGDDVDDDEEEDIPLIRKKTERPLPPNTFDFRLTANIIELASLSLEFVQMASFALQNDPYSAEAADVPTSMPTMAPSTGGGPGQGSSGGENGEFWGTELFSSLYVQLPSASDSALYAMWGSVGLVGILLLMFAGQFLGELRLYGGLMLRPELKDRAKDSFFFSFTGSIVYGHGKPTNITPRMRLVVATICDALFLVISMQLLQVFACDYDDSDGLTGAGGLTGTLRADPSVECWQGRHIPLAVCALVAYAFYVPLSIMIMPMLLEAPKQEEKAKAKPALRVKGKGDKDKGKGRGKEAGKAEAASSGGGGSGGGVMYLKLYLMAVNVVKSVMLLVGVLGPQSVRTVVLSSTIASAVLGCLTAMWFSSSASKVQRQREEYAADIHPCNIAFINYWKSASYTAAVASAVIIAAANEAGSSSFPLSMLTSVLLGTWAGIVLLFGAAYWHYHSSEGSRERRERLEALVAYPFQWRDRLEQLAADPEGSRPVLPTLWFNAAHEKERADKALGKAKGTGRGERSGKENEACVAPFPIPGFTDSPWLDHCRKRREASSDLSRTSVPILRGRSLAGELLLAESTAKLYGEVESS